MGIVRLAIFVSAMFLGPLVLAQHHEAHGKLEFSIRSARDGNWSDPATWMPARVPGKGDRVLIRRGTSVNYDVQSHEVLRLLQIVGTLSFANDRDTELNVGIVKIEHSEECSEHGFACDIVAGSDRTNAHQSYRLFACRRR